MKKITTILLTIVFVCNSFAQMNIDSLRQNAVLPGNEIKLKSLVELTDYYKWKIPDSCIYFALQGLPIAKKLHAQTEEQLLYSNMGEALSGKGNFSFALESNLKALKIAEKIGDSNRTAWATVGVGSVYFYSHDYEKSLPYYKKVKNYLATYLNSELLFSAFIGEAYFHLGQLDSAMLYIGRSYELSIQQSKPAWPVPFYYMGKIYAAKKEYTKAIAFYRTGFLTADVPLSKIEGYTGIAEIFDKMNWYDSAIAYAAKSLAMANQLSFANKAIESSAVLRNVYKKMGLTDSAFKYQEIMLTAKDSVYSQEKVKQFQNFTFNEQLKQQELIAEREAYINRIKIYGLIAAGAVFLFISIILLRNNRNKQKAYKLLKQQKNKTDETLHELKTTQAQLIQSEKMASLGELTAGIAHEIQNPLNFVNNFSEVNKELINEMKTEITKGNFDEVKIIADDIESNEEKINHHGKRADAIVKGMLQHSRQTSGTKEPTDINKLADEYLRLSYHGLRGKDKNFNATMTTDFDETIGTINIISQDIGRLLLNLYNNAFYAVNEKKKSQPENYEPTVSVQTKKINDKIKIRVEDNGNGIPQNIIDKIFQPFFTTKPTGQGTGLGLSLAYDIIRAHGGEIKVNSVENEGSTFIILLPS